MKKYKGIPITCAKEISKVYEKPIVCIVTFDDNHGLTHVTTYGKSIKDSENAANLGNLIKRKVLDWPPGECNAMSARVKRKRRKKSE